MVFFLFIIRNAECFGLLSQPRKCSKALAFRISHRQSDDNFGLTPLCTLLNLLL